MINIRTALEEDKLFIIATRLDQFVGKRDFFSIPNKVLMEEKDKIAKQTEEQFKNCKIIINDRESIGCFVTYPYEDGTYIEYIALKTDYNNKETKEVILKYIISNNYGIIYVHLKKDNNEDLELYKSHKFEIIKEENDMYKLKLNNI